MARVLICDDSAFMRLILKRIFTESGHEVVAEAADGTMAMVLARKYKPDLITMDITMPQMHGIEATKRIPAENSDRGGVGAEPAGLDYRGRAGRRGGFHC